MGPTTRRLAGLTLKLFGVGNLVVALWGGWFAYITVRNYLRITSSRPGLDPPNFAAVFFTLTCVNVTLLAVVFCAGVFLLRRRTIGVVLCNIAFSLEIGFFIAQVVLEMTLPSAISDSLAAAGGVGNMGIAPQILTGYPVVGLVALNLARRCLKSETVESTAESPR